MIRGIVELIIGILMILAGILIGGSAIKDAIEKRNNSEAS